MFSLDNFYYIVDKNFLHPVNLPGYWFKKFGSVDVSDLHAQTQPREFNGMILFYDQEPLYLDSLNKIYGSNFQFRVNKFSRIIANSEHSNLKNTFCRQEQLYDWYYFFHGFAVLDWYRNFKYYPNTDPGFTKVFISLNRLISKERSYRLTLVSNLIKESLMDRGIVSCQLSDHIGTWRDEVFAKDSKLSTKSRILINEQFSQLEKPFTVDELDPYGSLSANLNFPLQQEAFIHLVSETIFYEEKLHLTEKIFKPIVARRPFMLVGSPGNLNYLKSYGFKTFDKWIDESYDLEINHDKRIEKIVNELKRLCSLSHRELEILYQEMLPTLEYNFNHLYGGDFQKIIVNEMVENFESVLRQINVGKLPEKQHDVSHFDPEEVIKRLNQ